jgi:hypothetical protein
MTLSFPGAARTVEMRIESASEDTVMWRHLGDFPPFWVGTTVVWTLASTKGSTMVSVAHAGLAADEATLPPIAERWAQLVLRLKQHVETGARVPLFSDSPQSPQALSSTLNGD